MLLKSVLILLCVFCAFAQDEVVPPQSNVTLGPPIPTTTTISPTPTTTTTTTTKTPPTTPTTTPTTPSTPPTTPSTPPTTPTTPPTTTTTPTKPTTKPTPTPKPADKPALNNYTGNYSGSDHICLMVKVAIQLEVLSNNTSYKVNVPENVTYTAVCPSNSTEQLTVVWLTNKQSNAISFEFFKEGSQYGIEAINVTLLPDDGNATNYVQQKREFSVPDTLSFYCMKDQALNLTDGKSNVTLAKVHLSSFQYQAFMNTTKAAYASVWDCDGTNTSDVVPVVVGCVLVILVVLVLVVYLFGRRRCQARGYHSM